MATGFNQWEKDPFFPAAEEVQESADRMESVYRTWIHEMREASSSNSSGNGDESLLLRELRTTLGTAKWQLETLDKAVRSNDEACSAGDRTRIRHKQFIEAIGDQISKVENSLSQFNLNDDKQSNPSWVQLDDAEQDELALFLSLPPLPKREKVNTASIIGQKVLENQLKMSDVNECRKSGSFPNQIIRTGPVEEVKQGHRRTASASADISSWKITLPAEDVPRRSFQEHPVMPPPKKHPVVPPPKIPSLSCLTEALESTSLTKFSLNGTKNSKGGDRYYAEEMLPLRTNQYSRDTQGCEETNGCNPCCGHEHYDKQLHGWLGTFQRQLQRSQYHIQYNRPIQTVLWSILVVLLLVLLAFQTI